MENKKKNILIILIIGAIMLITKEGKKEISFGVCSDCNSYTGYIGIYKDPSKLETTSNSCCFYATTAEGNLCNSYGYNSIYTCGGECSLSNPSSCPHIGYACVTYDGIAGRYLCTDAFTYNGYTYCEDSDVYDCIASGYESCMDNQCYESIVCNANYEVCSDGVDFNIPYPNGDPYKCKSDGSGWVIQDNCLSTEHCEEINYDYAECICTPDCTCASTTCIGSTCSNGCGGTCAGTKDCICNPNWQCSSGWSTCSSSCTQTRTCTDLNNCGITCNDQNNCKTSQSCTGGNCVSSSKSFEITSFSIDKTAVQENEVVTATVTIKNNEASCPLGIDDNSVDNKCNWAVEFGLYPKRVSLYQPNSKKTATFEVTKCAPDSWRSSKGLKLNPGVSETFTMSATTSNRDSFSQDATNPGIYTFDTQIVPTIILYKDCAHLSINSDWKTLDVLPLTCANPGTEESNGRDDDCDGSIDEGVGPSSAFDINKYIPWIIGFFGFMILIKIMGSKKK